MGYKRFQYGKHKWWWHLNAGKRKRMERIFDLIDAEKMFISTSGDTDDKRIIKKGGDLSEKATETSL